MSVLAPPPLRPPPRPDDLEALIEEARRRARKRRFAYALAALAAFGLAASLFTVFKDSGGGNARPGSRGRGHGPPAQRISAAQARRNVQRTESWWRHQIRSRARAYPGKRFDNLPANQLTRRLARLAAHYDFQVITLELWHPLPHQLAPKIVVKTTRPLALSRATPLIVKQLDPRRPADDDRDGWRYEGFFFQANDEHAVPFLAVFNFMRGTYSQGGGQWARSDDLFPFAHGGRALPRHWPKPANG